MVNVLGKPADKPDDEPEQKYRQHNGIKYQKEGCCKPQYITNMISKFFSPRHSEAPFE